MHIRFSKNQFDSLEFIKGALLKTRPIQGGSQVIAHLFTESYGKISAISTSTSFARQSLASIDIVEIGIERRSLSSKNSTHFRELIPLRSIDRLISSEFHFYPPFNQEKCTGLMWKKALIQTGHILNSLLLSYEIRSDVWNFLEALFTVEKPLGNPISLPLLTSTLFLSEEGLDHKTLLEEASKLHSFHDVVARDIEILFHGNGQMIEEHNFSEITLRLLLDLLGVRDLVV